MYKHEDYVRKSEFFLLSVLLHILILLLLIFFPLYQNMEKNPEEQPKKDETLMVAQQEVASLKPRASVFGAPVVFQEEPEFMDNSISAEPSLDEHDQEEAENTDEPTTENQEQAESEEQPVEDREGTEERAPEKSQKEPQTFGKDEEKEEQDQSLQSVFEELNGLSTPKTVQQPRPQQQARRSTPSSQPRRPSILKRMQNNPGAGEKKAAPITKELTFADLASGFLHSIKNEGSDWLERKGNDNIRPDLEEMKYLSYKRKVAWHLQNAFRFERRDIFVDHPQRVEVTVKVVVDKKGKILETTMMYSSGNNMYDDFIVNAIKRAGSLPPIPNHFNKNTYAMIWSIYSYLSPDKGIRFAAGPLRR